MAARLPVAESSLIFSSRARFLDVNNEPKKKILSPLRDYENEPLLSLEESVSGLLSLNKDLQTDVWVAKQNSEEVKSGHLTLDERAAIHLYTMQQSVSRLLNEALRNVDRDCLLPWYFFLKLFLTALSKLESIKATVWRGTKGNYSPEFCKGYKFFWWGVSSCTLSRVILERKQFLGTTGTRTLFQIECIDGKDIRNFSHYENEEEVLLLPCSYFEILDITEEGNDVHIVHARQLEPPCQLIQLPLVTDGEVEIVSDSLQELKIVPEALTVQKVSQSKRRRQKQKQRRAAVIFSEQKVPTGLENAASASKLTKQPNILEEHILVSEHQATVEQSLGIESDALVETNRSTEQTICTELQLASASSMTIFPITETRSSTVNFDLLKAKPKRSIKTRDSYRMSTNGQYFLVCPTNRLYLLDREGNEYCNIERKFRVDDVCYSTYLNQFLILGEYDLYSLDLERPKRLMIEISDFARDMDECTCYENLFIVVKDFGGADIEVWDIKDHWKLKKRYQQPISCKIGQGICTIRFSSDGNHVGVTLTEPHISKAFFQLRNSEDMKILQIVELPFYEGYCNHYILPIANNEFVVYKYGRTLMFLFDSSGRCKKSIQYAKGICTMGAIDNSFAIQTSGPDYLHFYDL